MTETVATAYPLPWKWTEQWNGTAIEDANGKRIVLIRKGPWAGHKLAEWIIRCVNQYGPAVIEQWWAEVS